MRTRSFPSALPHERLVVDVPDLGDGLHLRVQIMEPLRILLLELVQAIELLNEDLRVVLFKKGVELLLEVIQVLLPFLLIGLDGLEHGVDGQLHRVLEVLDFVLRLLRKFLL